MSGIIAAWRTLTSLAGHRRAWPWLAAGIMAWSAAAQAAPVRGTVELPSLLKTGRRNPGYWRVDNGTVPLQPAPFRAETVVVLQGFRGETPAAKTVTAELSGLAVEPALLVVGQGSVLEIRNQDHLPHDLSVPEQPAIMPLQRLAPGGLRRQKLMEPAGYLIRSAEQPHIALSVVVVSSPHFAVVDEKGGFRLADVPAGSGALKIWSHGRWVHERSLEVKDKAVDLRIDLAAAPSPDLE